MPRLVSIAVESPKQYIAVDADGHVWRGRIDRDKSSQDYITWERIRSEKK